MLISRKERKGGMKQVVSLPADGSGNLHLKVRTSLRANSDHQQKIEEGKYSGSRVSYPQRDATQEM